MDGPNMLEAISGIADLSSAMEDIEIDLDDDED
jgi:hypothetical protein